MVDPTSLATAGMAGGGTHDILGIGASITGTVDEASEVLDSLDRVSIRHIIIWRHGNKEVGRTEFAISKMDMFVFFFIGAIILKAVQERMNGSTLYDWVKGEIVEFAKGMRGAWTGVPGQSAGNPAVGTLGRTGAYLGGGLLGGLGYDLLTGGAASGSTISPGGSIYDYIPAYPYPSNFTFNHLSNTTKAAISATGINISGSMSLNGRSIPKLEQFWIGAYSLKIDPNLPKTREGLIDTALYRIKNNYQNWLKTNTPHETPSGTGTSGWDETTLAMFLQLGIDPRGKSKAELLEILRHYLTTGTPDQKSIAMVLIHKVERL